MKKLIHLLLATTLLAASSAVVLAAMDAPASAQPAATPEPADLAKLKIVPVGDAIKAAVAATPGKVAKVTLEAKAGVAVYAVEIPATDNSTTTVLVDGASGKVTGSSVEFGAKKPAAPAANGTPAPGGKRQPRGEEEDDD
jgi:uncharacterized membrane protein YkoI